MRAILILLLFMPLAFAAWQSVAAMAIIASVGLLALIYMIGMGFGVNELQMVAKEELFQILAVVLLVAVLIGGDSLLNEISTNPAFTTSTSDTLQEAARESIDNTIADASLILDDVEAHDRSAAIEGSKASSCSILGMGYSVSGCGSYSMLAAPLSMAGGIAGFAIGELHTMKRLILISERFALPFLLPVGILLRTFKITRGAGGLLIAFAISLHIMLPMGVIFNDMLAATFLDPAGTEEDSLSDPYEGTPAGISLSCNAGYTGSGNEDNAIDGYNNMRGNIKKYLFTMLIRATLGPVLSLMIMAASLRALTSLGGAEVDVTALSRFV
jgi:hypothetical protein